VNSPPSFSFIPPHSWSSFNRYHFSVYVYIHVYTVFALNSPSHTLSPPSPPSHCYQLPQQDLFYPLILQFCERKKYDIFVSSFEKCLFRFFCPLFNYNPSTLDFSFKLYLTASHF
jgi:hypothetical protein